MTGAIPLRRLKPRAERLLARIEFAGELHPNLDPDYLVKGWLYRGTASIVIGPPGAAKTFFTIDLADHVQRGAAWAGARVRPGAVLYVAAEGGAMFANRLVAAKARFMVLRGPTTLAGPGSEAEPLADALAHLSAVHGPFALIVVDTVARVMGAEDENTAPAIAGLVRATDHLRDRTGAHVMLVHHTGKDAARGARGHSALHAAADTEITLTVGDDGLRMARATKQRDLPSGTEMLFRLEDVVLGTDADGDAVTTCTVRHLTTKGGGRTGQR